MSQKKNQASTPAQLQDLDKFELFFIANSKKLLIGAAVLAVVIAAGVSIYRYAKGAEARNAALFASAVTEQEIQAALQKCPSGVSAFQARIRLGKILVSQKKYKDAAQVYAAAAADKNAEEYLRGRAVLEQAAALELSGDLKGAAALCKEASADLRNPEEVRMEAAYTAGRLYASLKQYSEARTLLRRASVKNVRSQSASFWSSQADRALDRLPAEKKAAIQKEPPAKPAAKPVPAKK